MKKKLLITSAAMLLTALSFGMTAQEAQAHGYVKSPAARGYQGQLDKDKLGWTPAFNLYGNVITNPQSLETAKGFPQAGPADGKIASAEGGLGQIGDFVLDLQSPDRWKKQDVTTGVNTFTWHYTAPHKTAKWHYYITKVGWNQNAPLRRDMLEKIGEVDGKGLTADMDLSHDIKIPEDRKGYHVVLAVWDIADTPNAFYNVIDVNVESDFTGPTLPQAPEVPSGLKADEVTKTSASLSWNLQTDASSYLVYKDGQQVAEVESGNYEAKGLKANTTYEFQVAAKGANGMVSEKSKAITVKTDAEGVVEFPTAPKNLHSMGETTSSVDLMWQAASHSEGIKHYEIFQNGVKIAETNKTSFMVKGLASDTSFDFRVRAVSNTGTTSEFSNTLSATTLKEEDGGEIPGDVREFKLGSFTAPEVYSANEEIAYKGKLYKVLVTHFNYGDASWTPDNAASLFVEVK
ncbi:lytic polysaccharide monooxygenase [Lactococcus muris]|uniref:Lytic polysaccharide monooxygenase n=1 Tax=Lactococcus muris TaxID=2941330 RepID=A0ABV4D5I8_9LACT